MFFGPDGVQLPEEIEQALRAQLDRAEMSADVTRHDVLRFFDEMTSENLVTLRMLLHHAAGDESGRYASHLEGLISGVLQYKHGLCMGCGKKHDDASELIVQSLPNTVEKDDPQLINDGTEQLELFINEGNEETYFANMKKWGLRQVGPADAVVSSEGERPVICEGCGSLYQSLEDRMLRAPGIDGCGGCQHKSAHG